MAEDTVITPLAKEWLFYFSIIVNGALLSTTSQIQGCKPSFSEQDRIADWGGGAYFLFLIEFSYSRQSLTII